MGASSNTRWIHEQLSKALGFEVPQEMVGYLVSMGSGQDLEEYCQSLLNFDNIQHKQFYDELLLRLNSSADSSVTEQSTLHAYVKPQDDSTYQVKNCEKKSKVKKTVGKGVSPLSEDADLHHGGKEASKIHADGANKKRPKFVNLYSQEGQRKDVVLLKGRHVCQCQASKHKLVNNCIKCGRIVCEQEGAGPCSFCGNLVCSPEEMKVLQRNSRQSEGLAKKLLNQEKPQSSSAALAQRNRLLEYDRTSERRTKVIDDESDYYSSNSVWLSEAERLRLKSQEEAERARKHLSRRDVRFSLDFAGRRVIEDKAFENLIHDKDDVRAFRDLHANGTVPQLNMDPGIDFPDLKFEGSLISQLPWRANHLSDCDLNFPQSNRVQDKEFLEMTDSGRCLSMHQPWASLLIAGIKLHEGRNWYTAHRGRLWIAAAAKEPDMQEIRACENAIRLFRGDSQLQFPEHYPTGCLLGCVTVTDCLAQEEYRLKFPNGESDSPFVFICEDPIALPVRFPIVGQHKIYLLDSKILKAAQKSIQKAAKIRAERSGEK